MPRLLGRETRCSNREIRAIRAKKCYFRTKEVMSVLVSLQEQTARSDLNYFLNTMKGRLQR